MTLKKPSDLFGNKSEDNNVPVIESDNTLREELSKVENLSEQVIQLQQELSQKVIKSDLESLVLSQINTMQENFECLQNDFKKSNKKDIVEFKEKVSELTEIVGNLVENELPKYKKQVTKNEVTIGNKFDELKEVVEENIFGIREEIDNKVDDIAEIIDTNLEYFNNQLQETSIHRKIIEDKFKTISSVVNDKIGSIDEEVNIIKDKVSADISSIKADVVISEQHIKNVDKYLQEHHQELVELKEEVFGEIEKLPVGNLQENLERLEKKIDFIKETYSKIEPEVIVKEVIKEGLFNEPPDTKNSDPLTPLDQKFVTLDQLQKHYSLFINRIQQQLSTLGGGGEYRFQYLDGIVGIQTNSAAYNGKYLQWNSATNKAEFVTVSGGGGSQTLNQTLGLGNTSSLGMSVGVVTATSINFASGGVLGDLYSDGGIGIGLKASPANYYAVVASNNLQQFLQVDDNQIFITTGYASTTGSYDWKFDKNGALTFPNGALNIVGNKIRNVSESPSLVAGSQIELTQAKTVITNGQTNYLDGIASLTSQYLFELGQDKILSSFQTINMLDANSGLVGERLTELTTDEFKIGLRVTTLGEDPLTSFNGWTFGTIGFDQAITFPDDTVQYTAFTGYASTAGVSTYATRAGIATYASSSGIATYASSSGLSTSSTTAGYATTSGISTVAGYATTSGISTTSQGLTGTPNISVGIITATSYNGSGSNLTGIVTYITAGSGISVNQNSGNVTITTVGSSEGSWTVSAGAGTYSFTVPANANYVMWMRGNIPNGICIWNATVSISNTNVPVIGNQYGWYYTAGNQLVLTAIPSQIIGTSGSIITSSPAVSNTNTFSFGITNNSGTNQTVFYGYKTI